MRHPGIAALVVLSTAVVGTRVSSAQETLLPTSSWALAPIFTVWRFATPIVQAAGAVRDVQQAAVPFRASVAIAGTWSFDVTGAVTSNTVTVEDGGTVRSLTLRGLTDAKVRISGALVRDRFLLTAGVNAPSGSTRLDADQTSVLQVIGAPALRMPVGALGLGPGATLGFVRAGEAGPWALALGASLEERTEYTPIELALQSGNSTTKVTPGSALHVTVGADRPVGESRLSLLLYADAYLKDKVKTGLDGGATTVSEYKLGPQVSGLLRVDLAPGRWHDGSVNVAVRYRSMFSDASGTSVAGSSGTYAEVSLVGVRGRESGPGFILGADARYHTGLSFTDALVGAAVSAGGMTLGVELPLGSTVFRLAAHGQYGEFNTGTTRSNGVGASLMGAIGARREAR